MNNLRISEAFMSLLRSRRFIAAVVTLAVMVLVVAVPQLEPLEEGLVNIIVSIILALLEAPLVV
jgi:hypothetical protein